MKAMQNPWRKSVSPIIGIAEALTDRLCATLFPAGGRRTSGTGNRRANGARRLMIVALAALAASGCASTVRTQVTAFNDLDQPISGSVAIVAENPEANRSLEFKHYRQVTAEALRQHGLNALDDPSEAGANAAYAVSLGFYVEEVHPEDSGMKTAVVYRTSPWRYTGGEVVMMDGRDKRREYKRTLTFIISRGLDGERVYEATASSIGRCEVMTVVFDEMLEAILALYPQANGTVKTVAVAGESRC